jgi:hypothetical protein
MNYCQNCECFSCQQARATHNPDARAKADALRVITNAGQLGMTRSELEKFSRPFRAVHPVTREATLDQLVAEGFLIPHKFPPAAGRGKSRSAFVAAQVSQ